MKRFIIPAIIGTAMLISCEKKVEHSDHADHATTEQTYSENHKEQATNKNH